MYITQHHMYIHTCNSHCGLRFPLFLASPIPQRRLWPPCMSTWWADRYPDGERRRNIGGRISFNDWPNFNITSLHNKKRRLIDCPLFMHWKIVLVPILSPTSLPPSSWTKLMVHVCTCISIDFYANWPTVSHTKNLPLVCPPIHLPSRLPATSA